MSLLFLTIVLTANNSIAKDESGLHVHDPWIREAPPNAKMLAAYMVIENHDSQKTIITHITSPAFDKIEIHKSVEKDGMMRMEPRRRLVVHGGQKFILQPGDYHLMLISPKKPLKHGDLVPLTFELENGNKLKAKAKVKKVIGSMKPGKMKKSKSQHHDDNHHHEH